MAANISFTCTDIKTANGTYMYKVPDTTLGRQVDSICEAKWYFPNGTVLATAPPDPEYMDPAVSVDKWRLLANLCLDELLYRADCLSGTSEVVNFLSHDPAVIAHSERIHAFLAVPLFFIFLVILLICVHTKRRRAAKGEKPGSGDAMLEKSSSNHSDAGDV
ncbi:hypothetical protein AGOR_G00209050 [Albula goreensis]|uniref:Uncharacterized protein n=1 Tax=Albula goreensis TaxID=1534307 RepID=A0A8T3CQU2_9TELE|nr:hypothetical protein AGOR_G00209050 [Albula goreensis]